MSKICPIYVQDMSKICERYVKDIYIYDFIQTCAKMYSLVIIIISVVAN